MENNEALKKACDLLAARPHSTQELRAKLNKRKFAPADIETVIAECQRLRYLDDDRLACDYAAELGRQGKGLFKIKMQLRSKGFPEPLVTRVLNEAEANEAEHAGAALQRKLPGLVRETNLNKRREKAYRFLISRGFSSDIIGTLLENTPELKT
ncbi:MAG: regulatory protein RecX [Victivallaceae bacterium]|nr:regulatory protein RecX [Victivallaceae bacterium]